MFEESAPSVKERHERGFSGVFIEWYLFELTEQKILKWMELGVYAEIKSLCHKDKGCTATNSYIGSLLGIGEDRAGRIIGKLKKLNLVSQTSFDGRRRTLQAHIWGPADIEELSEAASVNTPKQTRPKHRGRFGQNTDIDRRGENKKEEGGEISPTPPKPRKLLKAKKGKPKKHKLTNFDRKAAAVLRSMFVEHEVPRLNRAKIDTLAEQIRCLREVEKIQKERIRDAIIWMSKNYGADEYVPSLFKAKDIVDKFGQFEHQMKTRQNGAPKLNGRKITRDNMHDSENCVNGVPKVWVGDDGKQYDGQLLEKIRTTCRRRRIKGLPQKDELDEVLMEMGESKGSIPPDIIGRLR